MSTVRDRPDMVGEVPAGGAIVEDDDIDSASAATVPLGPVRGPWREPLLDEGRRAPTRAAGAVVREWSMGRRDVAADREGAA